MFGAGGGDHWLQYIFHLVLPECSDIISTVTITAKVLVCIAYEVMQLDVV